jgi:acyl carrier protein
MSDATQNEQIGDKVKKIIVEIMRIGLDEVKPEASLLQDLGADGLDFVELHEAFKNEFDIDVSVEVIEGLKTVKDIVAYIEKSLKKQNQN